VSGTCTHSDTEPVEINLDHGAKQVVARICLTCRDQLPANWGCTDCVWVETRRLQDRVPTLLPGMPCARHANA